ncbi:MAG: cold shock domain-containing protein [Candidatus Marinimicrobia bacterium]|nr:cold shock domain-containing protein [Candidatus Neomarinimicrobiota bacterium]
MKNGFVKIWKEFDGWGFIEDEEGFDYFFHKNQIRKGQQIHEGDQVKFDVQEGQKGPEAKNVSKS